MLLKQVEAYWRKRAAAYAKVNLAELSSFKKQAWLDLLAEYAPVLAPGRLNILDIGTGPGFLAILLAGCGHVVSAVDYTDAMLEQARVNAASQQCRIDFQRMDAHKLDFADNRFDLIVSRNLTWDLERPAEAYREWRRVLVPGGRLLNFDANWYLHVYDPGRRQAYEQDRQNALAANVPDHYTCTDTAAMEAIARCLPLSRQTRPQWDIEQLLAVGFTKLVMEMEIGRRVWDEAEQVNYASTPMFMIGAVK
ncbi:MAG: class I SAM-dependent methyltransferase [Sporomusaceae bacterium]|nr:class I SAM-dependent methyltransferase [Sporomusaceae bacterium]